MAVNIGINGFGRVGRLVFQQLLADKNFEIVAINDAAGPDMLAYLLKYDTTAGPFAAPGAVAAGPDFITVKGKKIRILAEKDPARLPWKRLKVDLALECTGFFNTREKAAAHISAGAKRVVLCSPFGETPAGEIPAIVFGVNEKTLESRDRIISIASAASNCLAPMVRALHKLAPIQSGITTAIHASAGGGSPAVSDSLALGGLGFFRRSRTGAANIVPGEAAMDIGLIIPELKGKLIGSTQRVPAAFGSAALLTAVVRAQNLDVEAINKAMKAASNRSFGYNGEEIVSSDVAGCGFGSLFDATQTMVLPLHGASPESSGAPEDPGDLFQVQVISWYDNESSYASQAARTIKYFASLGPARKLPAASAGKPASTKPAPVKSGSAKPAAAKPVPVKPATAKAGSVKPAADKNNERKLSLPRKPLINFPK